ncbi:hypothetical protein Lepil_0302 [Leptonema illini DSM 21528]|uniref:DUF115 domain-containing protein n=1 Tax=Leptonema illini DSM 21528 TaxID=929563 RepID=H2CJU5_9LEPT|nr:hypothetical protein [Leptonema illini]EHQ05009.1 hypothetical protein Lepil_0302 [Leptonema illini DSM 21528]
MILPELDEPVRLEPPVGLPANLWIRDRPLHSLKGSEKEFERFLSTLKAIPVNARILLIGAGALFDRLAAFPVTLYEPLLQLRRLYTERTTLSTVGSDIDLTQYDAVIVHPAYRRMFPELNRFHREYGIKPESAQRRPGVDDRTTAHFLRQWLRNYSIRLNQRELHFFEGFSPAPSTFLFCGAGPSLLEDLNRYREQFAASQEQPIVLAADTAAAAVLHAGWPVDLVLSVDSGSGTSYHFALLRETARLRGIPLPPVLSWMAGSAFAEQAGFPVYFVPTLFPPDQILTAHLALGTPFANPYRNVLGYAVALTARHAGSRLLMAGVGFKPRQNQFYVRGTGYDLFHSMRQNRLDTAEQYHVQLTDRQRHANRSALARLQEAEQLAGAAALQSVAGPFQLRSTTYSGATLSKTLLAAHAGTLLRQEFGEPFHSLTRRHLAFCD